MFKDILVPMILGELPEAAVSAACTIARVFDAHVDALVGISMITPNAAAWSYYPEGLYATLKESARPRSTRWRQRPRSGWRAKTRHMKYAGAAASG